MDTTSRAPAEAAATTSVDRLAPPPDPGETDPSVLPQYSLRRILATWAAAALPMAFLAWVAAPWLAGRLDGEAALPRALLVCMAVGLVWQFMLVVWLIFWEQRSLRWSRVRAALWLRAPRSPRTGRRGGWVWLLLIPFAIAFAGKELLPAVPAPGGRDMGEFLSSTAGEELFAGAWGWFAVVTVIAVFNTVLGEELLFRGLLLPRMNGAFGRRDWVANGVLFATYHLHVPWAISSALFDTFIMAYPAKRYLSALFSIAVHSTQSVFILLATLALTL
ncbi:MAG: CPBP family intramembrane metalloprotease [Frankia sp.]|nr:CPBP family intramembrane metalloprotease [Frankia sp.]